MIKHRGHIKADLKNATVKGKNSPMKGRVQKAIDSVNASMAVEGLKPSRVTVKLGKQYIEGKISAQDALAKVKAKHLLITHTV